MGNNNIIKNRYYIVLKDNQPYAYISVKKDFYAEGILLEDKTVLSGYFEFYDTFKAFILDNSMQTIEHPIESICLSAVNQKKTYDISGIIAADNYTLYDANMDEYCYIYNKTEKEYNLQIQLIEDEAVIKNINFLIRESIRNLNPIYMFCYNSLKNHRYNNLKSLISDLEYFYKNKDDTAINIETINDLKQYLKLLETVDKSEEIKQNKRRKQRKNKQKKK